MFFLKLSWAFVKRFKSIITLGIFLGFLFFVLLNSILPRFITERPIRIGITGRYSSEELPDFVLSMVGEGLTKISETGMPIPAIASSWESTDNGKTWIFKIDKNAKWQDGVKITSADITYNFSDVNVTKKDKDTIIFSLKDPFTPFPTVLSKPVFKKGLLGTSNWKVKKLLLNTSFVQELELVNAQKQTRIFKFYPTIEATKTAFKLGKVDQIIDVIDPAPFNSWTGFDISRNTNKKQVVTLFFNNKDEILSDKQIRQTLAYAIDKDKLGERALGPVSPESWAYNPNVKDYGYDKQKALDAVKNLSSEVKAKLRIKLVTTPTLLSTAEQVAKNWNEIGVVTIVQVSSVIPTEFQAFLTILDLPDDPDQYPLWHSTQTETNISNYSNFRIDKILEDGRREMNSDERKKIYFDFQRFLLEDEPAVFMYYPSYYTISRK